MVSLNVLTVIILIKLWLGCEAEFFTSIADMETLLITQRSVIRVLNEYVKKEMKRINILKHHLERYKKEQEAMEDITNYVGNPVNAYTLIKRLTVDLQLIETLLNYKIAYKKNKKMKYPTQEDLDGAIEAITRIQIIYNLNTTELAGGIFNGNFSENKTKYTEFFSPMSASDCYELGLAFYKQNDYKASLGWLLEAYRKCPAEEEFTSNFTMMQVAKRIRYSYHALGDTRSALEWTRKMFKQNIKEFPLNVQTEQVDAYKEIIYKKFGANNIDELSMTKPKGKSLRVLNAKYEKYEDTYKLLCRGELTEQVSSTARYLFKTLYIEEDEGMEGIDGYKELFELKCRYLTETHPFLRLAPIKLEQLNENLDMVIMYDVLSDKEIRHLQDIAKPKLHRSMIYNADNLRNENTKQRICKSADFHDNHSRIVGKLSRRVSHFTGTPVHDLEITQVANYGIGGQFEPHIDTCTDVSDTARCAHVRRMGTVLFYMSEVTQGGATVFLDQLLAVYPKKGAAIFWKNVQSEGMVVLESTHAACPVLRGTKWVVNKWVTTLGDSCTNANYARTLIDTKYEYFYREFGTRN